jgi:hypothetical protein
MNRFVFLSGINLNQRINSIVLKINFQDKHLTLFDVKLKWKKEKLL